jgi:hypothetical protein
LTARLPSRSLTAVIAVALSMATIALLLSPAPQAQARTAACPPPLATHLKHGTHACVQAKGAARPAHKGKAHAHARPNVKGHHSRHGAKRGRKKAARRKPPAHSQTPAVCEDGSTPVNEGGGSFSCADESQPECLNGSVPVLSSNHSALVCEVKAVAPSQSEAVCEDGGAPVRAGDGSFSCVDESQPVCENGSIPTPSSSGTTLICGAAPSDNSGVTEVSCEDGTAPVLGGDGYYSCVGSSGPGCEGTTVPTLSSSGHWTSACDVAEPQA